MKHQTSKCKALINDEWVEAEFFGIFQKAWTIGESLIVGGHSAGQIAFAVVVVKYDGSFYELGLERVKEVD